MIFYFRLFKSILFFLIEFHYDHVMFIIIVFGFVLTRSSPVSLLDFYCSLPRDQSRDVTPCLGVFHILQCNSFRVCIFIPDTIITTA